LKKLKHQYHNQIHTESNIKRACQKHRNISVNFTFNCHRFQHLHLLIMINCYYC